MKYKTVLVDSVYRLNYIITKYNFSEAELWFRLLVKGGERMKRIYWTLGPL
jgi:hypothetical protein